MESAEETNKQHIIQNGFTTLITALTAYLIGYTQCSVTWVVVPILLQILRNLHIQRKLDHREFNRRIAKSGENEVLGNLKNLPAWVCFPDVERVEWLNIIIKQLWPNVNHYVKDLLTESVEDKIRSRLEKYKLTGFMFERIVLGTVPFRFGGVIVYEHVNRNEIIMDIDLSYAGDCDVTFRLSKMKGGIKNLQLYGTLRLILKPLINTLPFAGGLQVFFLNPPDIDFNLDGIIGLFEIPGISELFKKIVKDTVSSLMVLPNKFPLRISHHACVEDVKAPNPNGVLRVHLVQGKGLVKKEKWMDLLKSDSFTIVGVGDQKYRTSTEDDTGNPIWDFWCEFVIEETEGQELYIHLWDQEFTSDESVGKCTIGVSSLIKLGQSDMWLKLEDGKLGEIHIRTTWISLTSEYSDLPKALYDVEQLKLSWIHSSLLTVFLDCASNLPQVKSSVKPDPYVSIQVAGIEKTTKVDLRKINPVWEEGFTFLLQNPDSESVIIKIIDSKSENILAEMNYNISNLYDQPGLEVIQYPFRLKSRSESRITCSFHLKIFNNRNVKPKGRKFSKTGSASIKEADVEDSNDTKNYSEIDTINQDHIIRHRGSTTSISSHQNVRHNSLSEETIFGKINLTLRYSVQRQRLIVVIHSVKDIRKTDEDVKDIYVKLYILPERHKETKRKTQKLLAVVAQGSQVKVCNGMQLAPSKVFEMSCELVKSTSQLLCNCPTISHSGFKIDKSSLSSSIWHTIRPNKKTRNVLRTCKIPGHFDPFVLVLPCVTIMLRDKDDAIFDETFEFLISQDELANKKLEVSVVEDKVMKNEILGEVVVNLDKYSLVLPHTEQFSLISKKTI